MTISGTGRLAGAILLALTACGGDPFVLSDASDLDAAGSPDGGAGAPDAAPLDPLLRCPPSMTCALVPTAQLLAQSCCISPTGQNSNNCTGGACGCMTQLHCADDANCSAGQICCIKDTSDSNCGSGHFVASCVDGPCEPGETRLCDPNTLANHCGAGRKCAESGSDLQAVGLPANQGYGVCKGVDGG